MTGWQRHGIFPARAICVHGMRRSGNHAVIDWIMRNVPGGGIFLNNCKSGADPVAGYASLDIYEPGAETLHFDRSDDPVWQPAWQQPQVAVVSFEDATPRPGGLPRRGTGAFTEVDFTESIVIYRSFLQWAASLLRKIQKNRDFGIMARMQIMTRACVSYGEMLTRLSDRGVRGICFDHWVTDAEYRAERLRDFNLPELDNTLGQVQRFGGGSSFDRRAEDPTGMNLLGRAEELATDDQEYRMLLWIAAHDAPLMDEVAAHFPQDAARLLHLAETAQIDIQLEAAT